MKKIKLINECLPGKNWLVAGLLLIFFLCGCLPSNGQSGTKTDTALPRSVQVIKKNGQLTTIIHLRNGQIVKLDDSQTRSLINQSFETHPKVFKFVEQMPSFQGGEKALKKYLSEHIHYPKVAHEKGIQGTVVVQFIVGTDGTLRDFTVVSRKLGGDLEEEAIRVVKAMPDWIPGRQNGKTVNVQYSLPVRFVIP
ncbi:MAG: energy transducer TonB [Chitinophagaceae bacterium]